MSDSENAENIKTSFEEQFKKFLLKYDCFFKIDDIVSMQLKVGPGLYCDPNRLTIILKNNHTINITISRCRKEHLLVKELLKLLHDD